MKITSFFLLLLLVISHAFAQLPPPGLVYNPQTGQYENVQNVSGSTYYSYQSQAAYDPFQQGMNRNNHPLPNISDTPTDFNGSYTGMHKNYVLTLTVSHNEAEFNGHIDNNVLQYYLTGNVEGNLVTGMVYEQTDEREFDFQATLNGDYLDIFFWNNDPYRDKVFTYRSRFVRTAFPTPVELSEPEPEEERELVTSVAPLPEGKPWFIDTLLLGTWFREEMESGRVQQVRIDLYDNGTYRYKVESVSSSSFGRNAPRTGKWHTDTQMIYIEPDLSPGEWYPYATYRIDGKGNLRIVPGLGKEVSLHR